jgi:hypothetical protein
MTRFERLAVVFDIAIVLVFALFLWAPWLWVNSGRADDATSSSLSMIWLALPVVLSRHGFHLELATLTVTIGALTAAALGALLSIAAHIRGSAALWAVGTCFFGASVAILMPPWTAVGFLGALLLLLGLRARFVAMRSVTVTVAFMSELWPLGYAAGFAVLAWRYNPQLLIKALVIAFGISLVARALLPSTRPAS